jgi:hypothetical protein
MRLTEYLYPTEKTVKQPVVADPVTQPADEVQTTQPPVTQQVQPVEQVPPQKAEQEEVSQEKNVPSVSDRVSSEGYYNVLKNWNRPNFDDEEKRLRRNRSAALIGDMANIFAQGIALSRGARAFSPMQSQTAKANERIQSLQDMKRNENIDYQNKVLSSQYKDFELKRAEDQLKQKQSLDKYKLDVQNGQFGEEMKYKYDALQEQVRNHKISQEHADKVLMETARHNKRSESTAGYNAQSQRMSAQAAQQNAATNASKGNSSTGMDSITLTGSDGKRTTVDYPKSKNGALLSLYNRMKEESEKNPQKYGTLDDINMKMGEGGDQATKIISIVKRRIADFPQLTGEFNQLIGSSPAPKAAKSGSLLPNNNKPSLLP